MAIDMWIGDKPYDSSQTANLRPNDELAAMQSVIDSIPPSGGGFPLNPVQNYSGILSSINRFYLNPDEAVRASRTNARNMTRNLDIMEPLQARRLAVAELAGHVEPPNKRDQHQVWVAKEIQEIVDSIPYFLKLRYSLLNAVYFGKYGAMLKYGWDYSKGFRRLMVNDWAPLHGDSIYDKWDTDEVGILVGMYMGYPGTKQISTEMTTVARAHVLSQDQQFTTPDGRTVQKLSLHERDSVVVHRHDYVAGDFFEPEAAGGAKGLGLRSILYWTHYISSQLRGWMIDFMERVGTGITIVRYLRGNAESYQAAKTIAESNSNQSVLLFPVDGDPGAQKYENIERIEPSPVGLDNMLRIIEDYFGGQIRRFIVGQDATSRPISTGIGSKLAEAHENTFARIVKYDAINLQETITRELVHVVQRWTFPETSFKCRYVIATDRPNPVEYLEAAKMFWDMGGELDEDEVRANIGFTKPDVDSAVLSKANGRPVPVLDTVPQINEEEEQE